MPGEHLPPLDAREKIGRRIYNDRDFRRLQKGQPVPRLFKEKDGVSELSVDRLSHDSIRAVAEVASKGSASRGGIFWGWAALSVSEAQNSGRIVLETPFLDNPYHADIVIPLRGGDDDRDIQFAHANQLAANAVLVVSPSLST